MNTKPAGDTRSPLPKSRLVADVQYAPGVGPARAELLRRLGIQRCVDLLFHFPRDYEMPAPVAGSSDFIPNTRYTVVGHVVEMDERVTQSGKHMLGVLLDLESGGLLRLLWFNQPFRKQELRPGVRLKATGVVRSTVLNWEMIQPHTVVLSPDETVEEGRPVPIYPLTEGLKASHMRAIMRSALPALIPQAPEVLPPWLRHRLDVDEIGTALQNIHFPQTIDDAARARRRFKLQELLTLQLAIAIQRRRRESLGGAPVCPPEGKIHSRILRRLGVELTHDQASAVADIGREMAREIPMNRLLQGDVGSGKTVVAMYALLLCVAHGFQAALMAPTEVLASQHFRTLTERLRASRVRTALLTGSLTAGRRKELLAQIAAGEVDLVIGTQALLSEDVRFAHLGLVIVDEQHKFGVRQRARLRCEGVRPHYLVLTATPIPRTITISHFGDLDVSVLREKPPGRSPVHTYCIEQSELDRWWPFVRARVAEGRQALVIAPRVQASDDAERASAQEWYQRLRTDVLPGLRIGLLHGQLDAGEKETVLTAFADGRLDVLVATTVVEVGIDVPNATVMTILDADRLGLAQLHQLRGRVSRGTFPGYVCAVASPGCVPSDHQRLQAFERSHDGFELAELDLQLRGPGDVLGTAQSGLPPLRIASLVDDTDLIELAREVADEVLQRDPELTAADLQLLRRRTLQRYGDFLGLSDVG
ncbi:MAG: ATP-dependent DNA helicase RecG [Planctomycetota bacterium]|nr:MAG: ATP-dependent DNA helicase RecG [Planctomycetota bacterium]